MANENLIGLKLAVLVDDGFEQIELLEPTKALNQAGADTSIVSPKNDRVRGWNFTEWGDELSVDVALDRARPQDFDALLLPGGVINPDSLRIQPKAIDFIKPSSMLASRSRRSAMALGPSSRPARRAGGGSPRGRRSRPISRTPAPSGWITRPWWMEISSRAASLTTSQHSIGR